MKPFFIRDFANIGRYGRDNLPFSIVSYGRGRREKALRGAKIVTRQAYF